MEMIRRSTRGRYEEGSSDAERRFSPGRGPAASTLLPGTGREAVGEGRGARGEVGAAVEETQSGPIDLPYLGRGSDPEKPGVMSFPGPP